MHPDHAEFQGHLPGFRARAFTRQDGSFTELPMWGDTVWFFPNAAMGIILSRGGLAVQDSEASTVPDVLLAYERLTAPQRFPAHYETTLNERTAPELAARKFFDERPLKPERLPQQVAATEAERRAIKEENVRRAKAAREHAIASSFRMAGLPPPPAGLFQDAAPLPVEMPVITPGEVERMEVDVAGLLKAANTLQSYADRQGEEVMKRAERELTRTTSQIFKQMAPQIRPLVADSLQRASKRGDKTFSKEVDLVPPLPTPIPATTPPVASPPC